MDLLSSIRKSGSRGGVNFSWDEVSTSQHRENYLGHSIMAPVGRWQRGKDLSWYTKGTDSTSDPNETTEQKAARERKEEIKRIKEAEEDALARALGLPVAIRDATGPNAISVGEIKRVIKETGDGDDEVEAIGEQRGFGDYIGKVSKDDEALQDHGSQFAQGGLVKKGHSERKERKSETKDERNLGRVRPSKRHQHHSRERNPDRPRHRERNREHSNERDSRMPRRTDHGAKRERDRSWNNRTHRSSRSPDRYRSQRDERASRNDIERRSRSPDLRSHDRSRRSGRNYSPTRSRSRSRENRYSRNRNIDGRR